ncbi:hypothetical protein Tco_0009335 [Tanacetum coccineum]
MACSLPHFDSEVEALVQRLINEDKGRQDVLLNLDFQFEDSCAVRDDLRKAYEKCNDISQEDRALIERQMETKSAWFQEKYSGRTPGGIGCSSFYNTGFPLTEKELHQLCMDEEALKKCWKERIKMSYLVPLIAVVFVVVVGCYLASVPQEEDHQYLVVILGLIVPLIIVAIGVEVFWKK